jgi:hypothetical protein
MPTVSSVSDNASSESPVSVSPASSQIDSVPSSVHDNVLPDVDNISSTTLQMDSLDNFSTSSPPSPEPVLPK